VTRTTFQQHARLDRRIINMDRAAVGEEQPYGWCLWDECDRYSSTLYRKVWHQHDSRIPCEVADARAIQAGAGSGVHRMTAFCSDRHLKFWWNANGGAALASIDRTGRAYGNLPAGFRGRYG